MVLYSDFEVKEFDSAALTGAYQAFGTVLSYPCYGAIISNESNVAAYISIDGTNLSVRVGAGKVFPLTTLPRHKTLPQGEYLLAKGTQLYIKQVTAAGTGIISFNALMTR